MIKNTIKEKRNKLNLSQKDLAEQLGVSQQTVSYYEKGKIYPKMELALKMAQILKAEVTEIFLP